VNESLISTCQLFLIPLTILFAAVGVANSRFVKLLVWRLAFRRYGSIEYGFGADCRCSTDAPVWR
jgi:hypothetical protein